MLAHTHNQQEQSHIIVKTYDIPNPTNPGNREINQDSFQWSLRVDSSEVKC